MAQGRFWTQDTVQHSHTAGTTAVEALEENSDSYDGLDEKESSLLSASTDPKTSATVNTDSVGTTTGSKTSSQTSKESARRVRSRKGSLRKAALLSFGKSQSTKGKSTPVNDLKELLASQSESAFEDDSRIHLSPDLYDDSIPRQSFDYGKTELERQESTTSEKIQPSWTSSSVTPYKKTFIADPHELKPSFENDLRESRALTTSFESQGTAYSQISRAPSPLATFPIQPISIEAWDYAETERWGWFILIVTWMVFIMGMGSCFDVWSWAWAVGETPYAPPELEDDPTLPIVGYYPALIILTGVMAWIWVFIAWVGMKYFRHAKI